MSTKAQRQQQEDTRLRAIEYLRKELRYTDTLYTITRYVSASGMSRSVSVLTGAADGIEDLSWRVKDALGWKADPKHGGIRVDGAGMDMGFHLVYTLGQVLYPDGYQCQGKGKCHSNDHVNDRGVSMYDSERHHRDGGYRFNHRGL